MLTIFTPTYNRAYILPQLYDALCRQTMKDFEWIVIDDDSDDETEALIEQWISKTSEFEIIYRKQNRGGKHGAWNKAVQMAKSDCFVIIDSDDYPTDDAFENLVKYYDDIKDKPNIVGISALRGINESTPIGGKWGNFNGEYIDLPNLDRICKLYNVNTDRFTAYKTEVLRKYPFPEYKGEYRCCPESVILGKMALDGYVERWVNKIFLISSYLPDGLTKMSFDFFITSCPNNYLEYIKIFEKCSDLTRDEAEAARYWVYENLRVEYGYEEATGVLKKYSSNFAGYEDIHSHIVTHLNDYFRERKIRKIAVYGYGRVGKFFLRLSRLLDADVAYAIDLNAKSDGDICIYRPDDELEKADMILICLQEKNTDVENILTGKRYVYWRDIEEQYWDSLWN